ncbi:MULTISPECIES: phage portal protein [unclassified Geobacillus]|uniref:phage portal protein n=1 Tax=unclassified Geobacillus TaxID=2642459 RepID=UPI000D3C62FB|nr:MULTISPECIES: phage portal protein [unclassified Geobacillus]PUF85767.1 phage portal protein [Geobacillus sp. LYN3]TXK89063.1 phage portal protein [Geobacillus sp. AYS3]
MWNWLKRLFKNETVDMTSPTLLQWLGIDPDTPKDKLSEATYFACLKILAESLGKLPLKMYQNTEKGIVKSDKMDLYNILKLRPNPYMTSTVFWSTVEMNRNHYGNAYVWCRFQGPQLKDLWIMPSQDVTVVVDDQGILGTKDKIWYRYNDRHTGKMYTFSSDEVMHFKTSSTFDGLIGMPVRDILKATVDGALESQNFMNNLYKTGLTGKAVLEYTGDLNQEARDRLVKGFEQFANGSKNAGKIIPVPLGMKLVPLDIKLTDSQFFELKKYTTLQIAAAFGIKPNQINDYEKSSYASAEAQNLAFYVDTLLYILKQYEEEITYKILSDKMIRDGYFWKFNVNVILRADIKTQMEALAKGVNNGIYTPNEARSYLDLPAEEGGDMLMVNGNYIPITMVGQQYKKGGDS